MQTGTAGNDKHWEMLFIMSKEAYSQVHGIVALEAIDNTF